MIRDHDGNRFRLISGVPAPGPDKFLEEYLRDLGAALNTSVYEWTRYCLDAWEKSKVVGLANFPLGNKLTCFNFHLKIIRSKLSNEEQAH